MADGTTQVNDVVTPRVFSPYVRQMTEEKARLVQAGVMQRNPMMDEKLNGGGIVFDVPSWRDLDNDEANVSTDTVADRIAASGAGTPAVFPTHDSTPNKIQSSTEIAVRLNRNNSWSAMDLAVALAGEDPLDVIADRVSYYWTRQLQKTFIATWQGVSKDNGANDSGDYAHEIVGSAFAAGTTTFSAEAFLDAKVTMGDSQENLAVVMVHSIVQNRMLKNDLIDYVKDSMGNPTIPTFMGMMVVVDDGMPKGTSVVRKSGAAGTAGMYETWMFGPGAMQWGVGIPKVATEVERQAAAGGGGGQEVLYSRQVWALHPVGHAWATAITSTADGGPGNGTGANNLNNAGSWNRVYPERKQIPFARLITREH